MDNIYYISQGNSPKEHLENIKNVVESGVKLVQLRMKDIEQEIFLETAVEAKRICDSNKAQLIVNDNVEVAKTINSYGLHIGKEDMKPLDARAILSEETIIGGTANTIEDCRFLATQKVNYIGLGPFRFTNTKKKLSPILGLEGYQQIITQLRKEGIELPVYVIGGITKNDFQELYKIGVHGIAISGILSNKPVEEIKELIAS